MKQCVWTVLLTVMTVLLAHPTAADVGQGLASDALGKHLAKGEVCSDPSGSCPSSYSFEHQGVQKNKFEPFELSFSPGGMLAPYQIHKSKPFYGILLKSVKAMEYAEPGECRSFVSEKERLRVQKMFPIQNIIFSPSMAAKVKVKPKRC